MLYLSDRVGLWKLLKDMLEPQPLKRISSSKALARYKKIMKNFKSNCDNKFSRKEYDGAFFDSVIETFETCTIPDYGGDENDDNAVNSNQIDSSFVKPRPLHYVLTFDRGLSLGLVLSEAFTDDSDNEESPEDNISDKEAWSKATEDAEEGEVFVREIVKDGQADEMGLVEVGDRLVAVGDFPFANNGFEGFLKMLEKVPGAAKTIKGMYLFLY